MAGSRRSRLSDLRRPDPHDDNLRQDPRRHGPSRQRPRSPPPADPSRRGRGHPRQSSLHRDSGRASPKSASHFRSQQQSDGRGIHHQQNQSEPSRKRSSAVLDDNRAPRTSSPGGELNHPHHSHSHRHHHSHSPPPSKRRRNHSRSPTRHRKKRAKGRRSVSRSPSASGGRRPLAEVEDKASTQPQPSGQGQSETAAVARKHQDTYIPGSGRRRSRSAESHPSHKHPKHRRRSRSPPRKPKHKRGRSPPPRHSSPRRQTFKRHGPPSEDWEKDSRHGAEYHRGRRDPEEYWATKGVRSPSQYSRKSATSPPRRSDPYRGRFEPDEDPYHRDSRFDSKSRHSRSRSPRHHRDQFDPNSAEYTRDEHDSRGSVRKRSRSPRRSPRRSGYESEERSATDMRGDPYRRPSGPPVDTRYYSNSPSFPNQMSPHGQSPYGNSRGGWGGGPHNSYYGNHQGSPVHGYSPGQSPYHQGYPQGGHYNQQYSPPPYQQAPYQAPSRGGHGNYRGNHFTSAERRTSGPPSASGHSPSPATRGRGTVSHFSNISWTPQGGVKGGRPPEGRNRNLPATGANTEEPENGTATSAADDEENPFRPSKDLQVEDESAKDEEKMPPPDKAASATTPAQGPKISMKLKTKAEPSPSSKPKPDLSQRIRESPFAPKPKAAPPQRSISPSKGRHDSRYDRDRERERDRDRRDYYDRMEAPYPERRPEPRRGEGHPDRRFDPRERRPEHPADRRYAPYDRRSDFKPEPRSNRRHDTRDAPREPREPRLKKPATKVVKVKKIVKRPKPKPKLPQDFVSSNSVYYRKQGNESVVGSGTYGKVYKGVHVYTKDMVALKKIRMEGERDGYPVTAIREVKLLQSLNNDNVVKLHEVMVERNDCYMVFEYLSHDLTGLLNQQDFQLHDYHKKDLAKQLFEGLDYLHSRGVLHRDIKAANILVSNEGQLKLADFGLARFYAKRRKLDYTNRVITIWYRSPELLLGETQYGPAVDIWSAACVLMEIFTKHAIFPGDGGEINQLDRIYDILGTPSKTVWPGLVDMQWFNLLRPTVKKTSTFAEKFRDKVTPAAFDLLSKLFEYDPDRRPTAADVLEHPFFTSEEPAPRQAVELSSLQGDWHEFESKALRKQRERAERDARREAREREEKARQEAKEGEKRKPEAPPTDERDGKRIRHGESEDASGQTGGEGTIPE